MKVTLASLDLFHIVNQAQQLQRAGVLDHFFGSRIREEQEGIRSEQSSSCFPLHYGVRVMQRWPWIGWGNHYYLQLCRTFDAWLHTRFSRETDILTVLSGVGLRSQRAARKAGVCTVVDCGSTYTDHQHRVVNEEFRRNHINTPLFPEGYRHRVKAEFNEADFILLPSQFVINTFLEAGVPREKILQARYGVDLQTFTAGGRESVERPFRVVCSSGVNLRKGARVLAEAWRKLDSKHAELHWVGGPGPQTAHLFREPLRNVVWHPHMSHQRLAELYRRCDVLVLPSFEEGLARVLLEGAACGLALIATPNSGVEDFFSAKEPGEGWLVPAGDAGALAEAISFANSNRDDTRLRGVAASARAQDFSWERYGDTVIAHYARILER